MQEMSFIKATYIRHFILTVPGYIGLRKELVWPIKLIF